MKSIKPREHTIKTSLQHGGIAAIYETEFFGECGFRLCTQTKSYHKDSAKIFLEAHQYHYSAKGRRMYNGVCIDDLTKDDLVNLVNALGTMLDYLDGKLLQWEVVIRYKKTYSFPSEDLEKERDCKETINVFAYTEDGAKKKAIHEWWNQKYIGAGHKYYHIEISKI